MADRIIKCRMINLCFRTDAELIDLFHQHCKEQNLTRSEGFRIIFNEYANNLKPQKHEITNSNYSIERQ